MHLGITQTRSNRGRMGPNQTGESKIAAHSRSCWTMIWRKRVKRMERCSVAWVVVVAVVVVAGRKQWLKLSRQDHYYMLLQWIRLLAQKIKKNTQLATRPQLRIPRTRPSEGRPDRYKAQSHSQENGSPGLTRKTLWKPPILEGCKMA